MLDLKERKGIQVTMDLTVLLDPKARKEQEENTEPPERRATGAMMVYKDLWEPQDFPVILVYPV